MKIQLEKRVENLTKWFHRENERPLLGFYLDSQYPFHCYKGSTKHIPHGIIHPEDIVV